MPNLNSIVLTGADYKVVLSGTGPAGDTFAIPLQTLESIDYSAKTEEENIYRVGDSEPAALKTNASSYSGKLSMQAGEAELVLASVGAVFFTQLTNVAISAVSFDGVFVKIFRACVFSGHDGSIKAKDKQTLININFSALAVVGS